MKFLAAVKNLKYDELMTLNSKDNKIKFLAADTSSNLLNNMLLTISSEDENISTDVRRTNPLWTMFLT